MDKNYFNEVYSTLDQSLIEQIFSSLHKNDYFHNISILAIIDIFERKNLVSKPVKKTHDDTKHKNLSFWF